MGLRSTDLRETQVDFTRRRIGPAAGHDFGARVELDTLRTIHVEVAEKRVLPAAEAVIRHRHGNRYVDPDHSDFYVELELPRRAAIPREDRRTVAVGIVVNHPQSFFI